MHRLAEGWLDRKQGMESTKGRSGANIETLSVNSIIYFILVLARFVGPGD